MKLEFNKEEMNLLWHSKAKSILLKDLTRFDLVNEEKGEFMIEAESKYKCDMMWCESFLEAKILSSLIPKSVIMWDLKLEDWCVWSATII